MSSGSSPKGPQWSADSCTRLRRAVVTHRLRSLTIDAARKELLSPSFEEGTEASDISVAATNFGVNRHCRHQARMEDLSTHHSSRVYKNPYSGNGLHFKCESSQNNGGAVQTVVGYRKDESGKDRFEELPSRSQAIEGGLSFEPGTRALLTRDPKVWRKNANTIFDELARNNRIDLFRRPIGGGTVTRGDKEGSLIIDFSQAPLNAPPSVTHTSASQGEQKELRWKVEGTRMIDPGTSMREKVNKERQALSSLF